MRSAVKTMVTNSMYVRVNDIFDELSDENKRLNKELCFADKCLNVLKKFKLYLIKIHRKYETIIDTEDKQEFNQLIRELETSVDSNDQKPNLLSKSVKSEESVPKVTKLSTIKTKRNGFATKTYHKKRRTQIQCTFDGCPKTYKSQSALNYHINHYHLKPQEEVKTYEITRKQCYDSVTKLFRCNREGCSISYPKFGKLSKHITRVHCDRSFACDYPDCGKRFKTRQTVIKHLQTHQTDRPFVCTHEDCRFRSKDKVGLRLHFQRKHSTEEPFVCDFFECNLRFKTRADRRIHAMIHKSQPQIKCRFDNCCQQFWKYKELDRHYKIDHNKKRNKRVYPKNIACDWPGCDWMTGSQWKMSEHKRIHTGEKPFGCHWPGCAKEFRTSRSLTEHLNCHNKIKPCVCTWPGCQYKTSFSGNLIKHIKQVHKIKSLSKIPKSFGENV